MGPKPAKYRARVVASSYRESTFDERDLASLGNPRSVLTLHLAGLPRLALLRPCRGWVGGWIGSSHFCSAFFAACSSVVL